VVTRDEQPFHLRDPDRGALRGRVDFEEEVERTPGPLSNELEGLARGLGLARLDEVDGGPADVVAGHLAQAEARFDARLLDCSGSTGNASPPAATPVDSGPAGVAEETS